MNKVKLKRSGLVYLLSHYPAPPSKSLFKQMMRGDPICGPWSYGAMENLIKIRQYPFGPHRWRFLLWDKEKRTIHYLIVPFFRCGITPYNNISGKIYGLKKKELCFTRINKKFFEQKYWVNPVSYDLR